MGRQAASAWRGRKEEEEEEQVVVVVVVERGQRQRRHQHCFLCFCSYSRRLLLRSLEKPES